MEVEKETSGLYDCRRRDGDVQERMIWIRYGEIREMKYRVTLEVRYRNGGCWEVWMFGVMYAGRCK